MHEPRLGTNKHLVAFVLGPERRSAHAHLPVQHDLPTAAMRVIIMTTGIRIYPGARVIASRRPLAELSFGSFRNPLLRYVLVQLPNALYDVHEIKV